VTREAKKKVLRAAEEEAEWHQQKKRPIHQMKKRMAGAVEEAVPSD
jgi:hypothetical protein